MKKGSESFSNLNKNEKNDSDPFFSVKRAFSLVELIIAISLMGLIILAIVAVDVGSRGFLKTSDDESALQNEANFIMETIVKDLGKSFKGTKNNPSVKVPSNDMLEIRNRGASGSFELSNSKWVRYQFDSAAKTIKQQTCDGASSYPPKVNAPAAGQTPTINQKYCYCLRL